MVTSAINQNGNKSQNGIKPPNGVVKSKSKHTYSEYPSEFRMQILALLVSDSWISKYGNLVNPDYMITDAEMHFATIVNEKHEKYGVTPTYADMLLDMPNEKEFVGDIYELAKQSEKLKRTSDEVIEWAKLQAYRLAFGESLDAYEKGDFHKIRELFLAAERIGENERDNGLELIEDADKWMQVLQSKDKISTPWPEINQNIGGGLASKEMGIGFAPTKGGKSFFLVNIGVHAAGVVNRTNVLHFTLEHAEDLVLQRYAERLTFTAFGAVEDEEYKAKLLMHAKSKLRGRIRVKEYPSGQATVPDLVKFTRRTIASGFTPGMIIVDYPDLMYNIRKGYGEKRYDLQAIYMDLRAMAHTFECPLWAVSQSNRGSYAKKVITKDDIAEDIGKIQNVDVAISINRTRDEESAGTGRLYTAAVRNSTGGAVVSFKNFPAMVSTGFVNYDDKDDE